MSYLFFDSETFTFRDGLMAPPPVCFQFKRDNEEPFILLAKEGSDFLEKELRNPETIFVLQNGPYDWAVLAAYRPDLIPLIFKAHDDKRVRDTKIRQQLIDISFGLKKVHSAVFAWRRGEWVRQDVSLAGSAAFPDSKGLVYYYLGKDRSADKNDPDSWRLRYGELAGIPPHKWPKKAYQYAIDDVEDLKAVFEAQGPELLVNEFEQVRKAFDLQLVSCYGLITGEKQVQALQTWADSQLKVLQVRLLEVGLLRVERCTAEDRRKGKIDLYRPHKKTGEPEACKYVRNTAELQRRVKEAYEAIEEEVPFTDPSDKFPSGQIKTDGDTLDNSQDELLEEMGEKGPIKTIRSTFLPTLWRGTKFPINTGFNPLLETGRISSFKPNMNNMPRGGDVDEDGKLLPDVRSCFEPRPGFLFCSSDYDCAELRSHAQVCLWLFGKSAAAEFFQKTPKGDPHLEAAALMLGISYEEADRRKKARDPDIKDVRQGQKASNFGFPGGMGIKKFKATARKQYGIILTDKQAWDLKNAWLRRLPEMKHYFKYLSDLTAEGETTITQLRPPGVGTPHRVRGRVGYCDGANGFFQGLTADGAADALADVMRECYVDHGTALFGSRVVGFFYDELFVEVPEATAHEAAHRISELMVAAMNRWTPDVPATASPALMRRWYKGAEPAYDTNGRLIPWEPAV